MPGLHFWAQLGHLPYTCPADLLLEVRLAPEMLPRVKRRKEASEKAPETA